MGRLSTLVYACQASYMGGVHSGWTTAGKGACSIGWGGQEVPVATFSIWQNDWTPASNGVIPLNALIFGVDDSSFTSSPTSAPLLRYACIGDDLNGSGLPESGTSSGKVGSDLDGCLFGWGGLEIHQPNYAVLVDDAFVFYQDGWNTSSLPVFKNDNAPMGFYQLVFSPGDTYSGMYASKQSG